MIRLVLPLCDYQETKNDLDVLCDVHKHADHPDLLYKVCNHGSLPSRKWIKIGEDIIFMVLIVKGHHCWNVAFHFSVPKGHVHLFTFDCRYCCLWQTQKPSHWQSITEWYKAVVSRCPNKLFRRVSCQLEQLASKDDWFLLAGLLLQVMLNCLVVKLCQKNGYYPSIVFTK